MELLTKNPTSDLPTVLRGLAAWWARGGQSDKPLNRLVYEACCALFLDREGNFRDLEVLTYKATLWMRIQRQLIAGEGKPHNHHWLYGVEIMIPPTLIPKMVHPRRVGTRQDVPMPPDKPGRFTKDGAKRPLLRDEAKDAVQAWARRGWQIAFGSEPTAEFTYNVFAAPIEESALPHMFTTLGAVVYIKQTPRGRHFVGQIARVCMTWGALKRLREHGLFPAPGVFPIDVIYYDDGTADLAYLALDYGRAVFVKEKYDGRIPGIQSV